MPLWRALKLAKNSRDVGESKVLKEYAEGNLPDPRSNWSEDDMGVRYTPGEELRTVSLGSAGNGIFCRKGYHKFYGLIERGNRDFPDGKTCRSTPRSP